MLTGKATEKFIDSGGWLCYILSSTTKRSPYTISHCTQNLSVNKCEILYNQINVEQFGAWYNR